MITNTGKNIIAKYLIGDTPAYASYIALGCGPSPRPNVSTISNANIGTITGQVLSVNNTTQVNNIASTAGLVVGMTLTKTSGTGAFGSNAVITSIDSLNKITITAGSANTLGSITFNTSGVASLTNVSSTTGLWLGAKVLLTSGNGALSTVEDTIITAINSDTSITLTPAPTTTLSSATLSLQIDPAKKALDFEMFRVPISSRGYVNDNGINKIILTAQLPTEERYEISEIGIYSAGSNAAAGQYDSKTISAFSNEEGWQLIVGTTVNGPSSTSTVFPETQTSIINGLNVITTTAPAIKLNTSNGVFSNATRSARYERPRYLSNVILLKGDTTHIYKTTGNNFSVYGTPTFLQLSGKTAELSQNSSSDLLKLAFSIVSVNGNSTDVPDTARIIVEFSNDSGSEYARMQVEAKDSVYRFTNNRYITVVKRLDELTYSSGQFSWKNVNVVKAYVSTIDNLLISNKALTGNVATLTTTANHNIVAGDYVNVSNLDTTFNGTYEVLASPAPTSNTFSYAKTATNVTSQAVTPNANLEAPSNDFYIALDALRIDNISSENPLYGLVGYSIVQNATKSTIIKSPNTSNYLEYRFVLDVT